MTSNEEIKKEMDRIEGKIDSHISVYKKNGDAIRRNNELVIALSQKFDDHIGKESADMKEIKDSMQPAIDLITTITYGRRIIIGTASTFAAVGIIVASVVTYFKGMR